MALLSFITRIFEAVVFALIFGAICIAQISPTKQPGASVSAGSWSQLEELVVGSPQVAISGDFIVTGGPYVLQKSGAGWKRVATLTPASGGALAFDGNTIVVNGASGSVNVYAKPANGWTDTGPTATLTASDGGTQYFGDSVSISGDTIVVGDPAFNSTPGSVYVYVKPSGGWTNMTQTAKLIPSGGAPDEAFGFGVSISGNAVAVGALSKAGKAYVFVEPASGWRNMTQTGELTLSHAQPDSEFGYSISIDGDNVLVGSPGPPEAEGTAYIFTKPAGGWTNMTQTAELRGVLVGPQAGFGSFVVITAHRAAVTALYRGIPPNSVAGGVYIFDEPPGGWQNTNSNIVITGADAHFFSRFGLSLAMSGNLLAIGREYSTVYIFGTP